MHTDLKREITFAISQILWFFNMLKTFNIVKYLVNKMLNLETIFYLKRIGI